MAKLDLAIDIERGLLAVEEGLLCGPQAVTLDDHRLAGRRLVRENAVDPQGLLVEG